MSNRTFLLVVGTLIVLLVGTMLVEKFEACLDYGGKACPTNRYGVSMDPYQRTRPPSPPR